MCLRLHGDNAHFGSDVLARVQVTCRLSPVGIFSPVQHWSEGVARQAEDYIEIEVEPIRSDVRTLNNSTIGYGNMSLWMHHHSMDIFVALQKCSR